MVQSGSVSVFVEKMPAEYYSMMCGAYGYQVMSHRQVFHWHKQFREGHASVAVKQSGRSALISTEVMINTIRTLNMDDSSSTQYDIAVHLDIANGMVQKILKICLIVVHNPIGVNFRLSRGWFVQTLFVRSICYLRYFFKTLYSSHL